MYSPVEFYKNCRLRLCYLSLIAETVFLSLQYKYTGTILTGLLGRRAEKMEHHVTPQYRFVVEHAQIQLLFITVKAALEKLMIQENVNCLVALKVRFSEFLSHVIQLKTLSEKKHV